MVYVGEIDDTRRRAVMRPPSRPAHALPTLADYRLKPRGELPGESWLTCCEQERAYTRGFDWGRTGGVDRARPYPDGDGGFLTKAWRLGYADGLRVRERRAGK